MDPVLIAAILVALAFAMTNGFNDAANAIATLIATRAARPLPAIAMASVANLLGPFLLGAAVADTVAGIVDVDPALMVPVIGAGLSGAVSWNLFAWKRGIPSSSSHALVGGLVGAAIMAEGLDAVSWGPFSNGHISGVFGVLIGIVLATLLGFGTSWVLEHLALRLARRATTRVTRPVRAAQWLTSAWLAFSHGANDSQKVIGAIGAMLVAAGYTSSVDDSGVIVVMAGSLALTVGTALGGWRIVKTVGQRIYPLHSIDGLVSQASSAGVIFGASIGGLPVSTSQVVSSSVVGIGAGRRRWRHVSWGIVRDIGVTWLTTMPAAAIVAVLFLPLWRFLAGV